MSGSRSGRSSGNAASAVKVPKEIQVRKLKEAFKKADANGEGRVDINGFVIAIRDLKLGGSDYAIKMLFFMSIPNEEAQQLTYMDFYKTLKKGCENYPGCTAQDVVGNLVLEFGNTSAGRRARNTIKQMNHQQSIQREKEEEEERRKKEKEEAVVSPALSTPDIPKKVEDIRDIANNDWASKDSLEIPNSPDLPDNHGAQSEVIPNSRQYVEPKRSNTGRAGTVGRVHDFNQLTRSNTHDSSHSYDNRERMSDRGSERDGGYYEGSNQLRHGPHAHRSYHQYSASAHMDLRNAPPPQQAKTRSSLDFRNAQRLGIVPQQMDELANGSTYNPHIQDISENMGSDNFLQGNGGSMGSRHKYSDSRATLPDDFVEQFEQSDMNEPYSNYLSEVDDILDGRASGRGSFLHRRNRSVDRPPQVDLSHITNYLRSQDQILNARLISLEDNLRRQMNAQHTLLQGIPVYNKTQIKSWINTETQLLNHAFKNIMDAQMKGFKEILENGDDAKFQDESRKTYDRLATKMTNIQHLMDKVHRNSNNNRLEIGEISNTMSEMQEQNLRDNNQRGDAGGTEAMNSLMETQTDTIEACVNEGMTDIHMKLGSKIERVENILLAVAVKNGIAIPDSPDWEKEHAKLADQHVKVLQQQQAALDAQSKELKKIKTDMQREAMKLKEQRQEILKFKQDNQKAQKDLAEKEESVGKALVKLKTERELMRQIKPTDSVSDVHLPTDIKEKLAELEAKQKVFKEEQKKFQNEKEELVKTQENKLFQIEHKMKELQELKADIKAEKQKLKAKREQMKKDEKHVEDCKNDLETIFDEIARKRNEVLNREQSVQKREEELKKMEREVKVVIKEKKDLAKAREKINELKNKFVDDLKVKEQEIEAWKKQASRKDGDSQGLAELQKAFDAEKSKLVERHNMEKKKLAIAAREKFRKDFEKEINNAKREIDKLKRSQEKEKAALKEMKAELMQSVQQFEQQKKQSKREIRHEREALHKEKARFKNMIEAATPRGKVKNSFGSGLKETGGDETSIDAFLEDLGPILSESSHKTTE